MTRRQIAQGWTVLLAVLGLLGIGGWSLVALLEAGSGGAYFFGLCWGHCSALIAVLVIGSAFPAGGEGSER